MAYELTENLFMETETIGPLSRTEIVKLLKSCATAVTAKFPVVGATDPYNIVRKNGEYGAYRLTLAQICDAGYITPNLITTVQKYVSDAPAPSDKIKTTHTYFEMCQTLNTNFLENKLTLEPATIEARNNGQYYYLSHVMNGCAARTGFSTGQGVFQDAKQDLIAFDYLTFVYNNLLTARVVTVEIDKQVLSGLLAIALCSTYDDAVNFSKGVIKSDTNGISAKYWYDYGWNALASQPKQVTEEPAVKTTEVTEAGGTTKQITTATPASEATPPVVEEPSPNPLIKYVNKSKIVYSWDPDGLLGGMVELYYEDEQIFHAINVETTSFTDLDFIEALDDLRTEIKDSLTAGDILRNTNLAAVLTYLAANYETDIAAVKSAATTPPAIPTSATQPKSTVTDTGNPPYTQTPEPTPAVAAIPAGAAPASNTPTQTTSTPTEVKNQISPTCYVEYSNFGNMFKIIAHQKTVFDNRGADIAYVLGYTVTDTIRHALENLNRNKTIADFSSVIADIDLAITEIQKNAQIAYDILNPPAVDPIPAAPTTVKTDSPIVTNTINNSAIVEYTGNDSIPAAVIKVYYLNGNNREEIANNCPANKDTVLNQVNRAIDSATAANNTGKAIALTGARNDITSNFEEDVAYINNHYKIVPPTSTTETRTDGTTVTTTRATNPDGSIVTRTETVNPTTGLITKEETVEKKSLPGNKAQHPNVTDPVTTDVPIADQNKVAGLNDANSIDTYRANQQPSNKEVLPASQQDPSKGFKDPENRYPLKTMVNKPDTNPLAVGVNSPNIQGSPKTAAGDKEHMSAGASPAARNSSRKREVKTAGRNGATWSQPESPYAAQYPFNKVMGSESGHAFEIDDTPGAERLNLAHRSGTFTETGPDGTQVTKIVGDSYTITDRDGYIMIEGVANVHVAGNCNVVIMSDTNLTMHGKVSMDFHNDLDVNIGGKLSMSVGGGIYARNAGKLSLVNYGNIDVDAMGNLSTDVTGNHNLTTYGENRMTSKGDIHVKTAGDAMIGAVGSFNVCADETANIKSTGATNIKSGAEINAEGAGNINLKAELVASSPIDTPTLDVTTANISTLNAGSTNLRATGTDTGTNGGSTHNLPISGPTSATVTEASAAAEATCPSAAALSTTETVEEPVSVSSTRPTQYVGGGGGSGGSGGNGGGSYAPDNTENDGDPEDGAEDPNCEQALNGDPSQGSGPTDTEGTGGTGSGDMTAGNVKASPACDTLPGGRKLPALAKSGFPRADLQLSEHYYLRDFVTGPLLTSVRSLSQLKSYSRGGYTMSVWDIVQNYRCLALNVLEPIVKQFGKPTINDGYRDPAGKKSNSAHQYAAIDIQFSGGNKQRHIDIATWAVKQGLPHDQLLVECKPARKTAWIHIGYYWYNRQQRGEHWCGIQDAKATRISPNKYSYVSF